jgi:hypothetical protein
MYLCELYVIFFWSFLRPYFHVKVRLVLETSRYFSVLVSSLAESSRQYNYCQLCALQLVNFWTWIIAVQGGTYSLFALAIFQ